MTDTSTATNGKAPREKSSERLLLAADGKDVAITEAVKAIYKIPANGRSVEYVFGTNPIMDRSFAFFGFHTKLGNVANTMRNSKDGTPDDEADVIETFFANLANGQWREPSDGPRGPKYDDDILADVVHAYFVGKGIAKKDRDGYHAQLTTDAGWRAKVLGAAGVKDLYLAEAEKRGVAIPKPAAQRDLADLA